jgi:hypothetical protein
MARGREVAFSARLASRRLLSSGEFRCVRPQKSPLDVLWRRGARGLRSSGEFRSVRPQKSPLDVPCAHGVSGLPVEHAFIGPSLLRDGGAGRDGSIGAVRMVRVGPYVTIDPALADPALRARRDVRRVFTPECAVVVDARGECEAEVRQHPHTEPALAPRPRPRPRRGRAGSRRQATTQTPPAPSPTPRRRPVRAVAAWRGAAPRTERRNARRQAATAPRRRRPRGPAPAG